MKYQLLRYDHCLASRNSMLSNRGESRLPKRKTRNKDTRLLLRI